MATQWERIRTAKLRSEIKALKKQLKDSNRVIEDLWGSLRHVVQRNLAAGISSLKDKGE